MKYYYIHPSVPGSLGENTIFDRSVNPPRLVRAHYVLDELPDVPLFKSSPLYVVSEEARRELLKANLTGISFGEVEISKGDYFEGRSGDVDPGVFFWLKIEGNACRDDFGISPSNRLVISQRALDLFEELGIYDADIDPVINLETDVRRSRLD